MAGPTPKGFPYPSAGDAPNIPSDIQALATAIDTEFDNYASETSPSFSGGVVISSGNLELPTSIIFEGSVVDGNETTLTVTNPTADRSITLPDLTGTVMLRDASETISNKTLGSNLVANGNKITGLGAPSADTDSATNRSAYDNSRTVGMLLGGM